jgi:3-oxoacyl-[acyl-carrier-protein] synthase II
MRRVVVTGVGALSPVGNDAPSSWQSLLAGRSGIGPITRFDASQFSFPIAGEVKGFDPEAALPAKVRRNMDVNVQYACATALEALADAGVSLERPLGETAGVIFGSGVGGYNLLEEQTRIFNEKGPRRVSPFFLANILPDAASGYLAMITGATGPNMAVVSACATGAAAVGESYETIRRGDADLMIAGGTEAPLTAVLYSAFAALRAIATYDDDPATACKPFDARRDGFVIAEGAACLILEDAEHAARRGARVYAEVCGYGSANDAFDMQASEENGRGAVLAVQMALRKAEIDPNSIGYVNAHGTGTQMNDRVETLALKRIFAKHAYRLAVSSTKSMTGHMMGAAGAFEAVASVLALHEQVLPPTLNYRDQDPDCDLDYVPNEARRVSGLEAVLSTSIGLGGHNAALIFKRAE